MNHCYQSTISPGRWSTALMLSGICLGAGFALMPSERAIANDSIFGPNIEVRQETDTLNGIFCVPDCGRFFKVGQENLEQEIQQLEERVSHLDETDSLLQVDSTLQQRTEEWQRDFEQNLDS